MQSAFLVPDAVARRRLLMGGVSATACALVPSLVHAQDKYPSRPIEFVVPWGPGGGADQLARRVSKLVEADLKVSIPVINVPGATGNTGMAKLLSAPPDGHTMAILIGDTLATIAGGGGRWKLPDVVPLGVMIRQPSGLFVKTDSKYNTLQDLLADARGNEVKVAILGFGSADEILINQINAKGAKLRMVPFASPGERYSSILGGHADVLIEQAGDIRSFLDGKQMRPLTFLRRRAGSRLSGDSACQRQRVPDHDQPVSLDCRARWDRSQAGRDVVGCIGEGCPLGGLRQVP